MRMIVELNGKQVPKDQQKAFLVDVSRSFRESSLQRRFQRAEVRHRHTPERLSVEKAMLTVEAAFVNALWVLQRTEGGDGPCGYVSGGIAYEMEAVDAYGQALANGGWQTPAPRPAIPSAKEISAAERVQTWVRLLDPLSARVLTVGAMSKRGDAGRKINWERVRHRLPELAGYSRRSLQGIYTGALREIVAELTTERMVACG